MIWILLMTAIFGPLVVPSVMGVLVWIERSKHNARKRQRLPNPTDWWRRRSSSSLGTANVADVRPRHFKLTDALNRWGILAVATVLLIAPALWQSLFWADFLLAAHPVLCVAWWLTLRRRGVVHAEVYPLSVWVLAYVAWVAGLLAPAEWIEWRGATSSGGPGIVARGLWLLYIASGLACVTGGIALARMAKPPISPLLCVAVWMPLAYVVWTLSILFGVLGLMMTVGVVGFGISREVRRLRDEAETHDVAVAQPARLTFRPSGSIRLIASVCGVIIVASVLSIGIRESGALNQAGVIAVTWSATVIASLLVAWMARRDDPGHNIPAWAAGVFIAVTSLHAFLLMLTAIWPWFTDPSWVLEASVEGEPSTFLLFTYVQATFVGLIAAALLVIALLRGHAHAYGAMLLGILWVPIALAVAATHSEHGRVWSLVDPVGIAGATAMGCVLLVIMWRILGPGALAGVTNLDASPNASQHAHGQTEPQENASTTAGDTAGISTVQSESDQR